MKIPNSKLSASQFRTYGAGGFRLDDQEDEQGCPRLYHAKYVQHSLPDEPLAYPLLYGSLFHRVLYLMEEQGLDPEQALAAAFEPWMPQEAFEEARHDLIAYVERGASPTDRYATLAVESRLEALLYVDEEFGPIRYGGIVDWIGVDPDQPNVVHGVDYKTNRHPPRQADLDGDVQLRGYDWLLRQNAAAWVGDRPFSVVMHLDVVKFREIEVRYSDDQIEDWHAWAVAVARAILRDEEHAPRLNARCPDCPIRHTCPVFLNLPATAFATVEAANPQSDVDRLRWRDEANRMRLVLEKAVATIDEEFRSRAEHDGVLRVGDTEWTVETDWKWTPDMLALHAALGDDFYRVVSVTKTALNRATRQYPPDRLAAVNAAISQVPDGTKVVKRKVK